MRVKLENISVSFSSWVMKDLSLEFDSGSFTSIVGPSGCGKTTLLRIIAGLQQIKNGKIFFGGKDVTNVPTEQRNTGFVFQGDALFSNLNASENVAFGLKMKKIKGLAQKVSRAFELVHLQGFEERFVEKLSGGEKRRVALARAIAFGPDILLLDEPLNGLDAPLKEKMKLLLKELQEKTKLTVVMVTHDIDDAFFLSDKIVVMSSGKIEQSGSAVKIFREPKNSFVKDFVSDYVLVEAEPKKINGKDFIEGRFLLPSKKGKKAFISFKKTNQRFL